MLFHHAHVVDGHAAVHGLAHVVDGEQGHLDGGEGFHLYAGGADGFHGCGTKYACSVRLTYADSFEFNSDADQRQGVAQWDEVAGFLGRHDAGDAGDAGDALQIAFFGGAGFDEGQGGGQHFDAAAGDGDAVRGNHSAMGLGLPWGHASNGLQ